MSIYMDDVSVAGGPEEVKKRIRKCARSEVEKNDIQLKQNKLYGSKDKQRKEKMFQGKWKQEKFKEPRNSNTEESQ